MRSPLQKVILVLNNGVAIEVEPRKFLEITIEHSLFFKDRVRLTMTLLAPKDVLYSAYSESDIEQLTAAKYPLLLQSGEREK
jgi:hypothetical protein